jgi:hypothetical protein
VPRHVGIDLDQKPSNAARWAGAVLSALIAIFCLGVCAVLLVMLNSTATSERAGTFGAAAFFGFLGCAGLYLFFRAAFTQPGYASLKTQRIFGIVVAILMLLTVVARALQAFGYLRRN